MAVDVEDYTIIKEGEAEILMHRQNAVFYNKTQVNNKDLSVAVLRTFLSRRQQEHEAMLSKKNKIITEECDPLESKVLDESCCVSEPSAMAVRRKMKELKPPIVLEALSASGLRSLRYAREVEGVGKVVALDNDKASVEACQRNIKFNGSIAMSKVESHLADARVYMLTHPNEFDMV